MYKLDLEKDSIFIIDGTNLMHRNYHVNKDLKTSDGRYTGAIFGTIKMIKNYYELYKPKKIIVCFDKSKKTFRHLAYPEYKAGRPESDKELKEQFHLLREFCLASNIPYIASDSLEADDLLGSLSKNAVNYGLKPYVVSGDKDMFQLIDKNIQILYLSRDGKGLVIYNNEVFEKEKGIKVEQFIDYKALNGDKGDNIPGVLGIGEVFAVKLLNEYGNLKGIYSNIENIKGKTKEKLEVGKDNAFLSQFLATIKCDVPLPYNEILNCNIPYNFNSEKLKSFLEDLEINLTFEDM